MALTVEDLTTPLGADAVKSKLYTFAALVGLVTTAWQLLSPLRSTYAAIAQLFAAFLSTQAEINRSAWKETATGNWLTIVAAQMYGVTRTPAQYAQGNVEIDNSGGGVYAYNPGELIVLNPSTNKTYANTAVVNIGALQQNVIANVKATEVGADSNATPGQINSFASAVPGLTVTNPTALVGVNEETDADLRVRCDLSLGALSPNGAADAYRYVAVTPSFNGGAAVNRVRVLPPPGDGTVTIVLAGPSGAVSGGDVTLVDDAFQALVVREVDTATAVSSVNTNIAPTIDVWYSSDSGYDDAGVIVLVTTALGAYINALPIGGVPLQGTATRGVPWRSLEGIAKGVPFVLEAKLASEVDTVLASNNVAVLGALTVVPHKVIV